MILSYQEIKKFAKILIPVMLLLGLISITGYIERLLLARYSTDALSGGLNAFFLARVFQAACLSVTVIGQAYVGLYYGAGQLKSIGSCVWQLIWFSFLSIGIVVPVGLLAEQMLFGDTSIAYSVSNYFYILCAFNFLYPLGGALSAFYLGRGIAWPVVLLTVGSCLLNIGLDVILIFGMGPIPPLGATGAGIARVAAQGSLSLILFALFLSNYNRQTYSTDAWRFYPKLFWHYVRPGVLRAIGAFGALGDWVVVSRYMTLKSEAHQLVFSLGSTLFYLLTFIGDGLFQTMVTVSSNRIGKKNYQGIWISLSSGLFIIALLAILLIVPFFVFPQALIQFFDGSDLYQQTLTIYREINSTLWLAVIAYALNALCSGIIVASRDAFFLLCVYCGLWVVSFVPVYITMDLVGWSSTNFWYIVTFSNLVACTAFLWRASKERWKVDRWDPSIPDKEINPSLTPSI
jgi:MATE family multidrug resistance protein